ncbi:glucokinase [Clostridium novyi A str. 4552]|uniref:Glucokinase n=1 Tax=Clostridium novyi A str. 4552 TaxID=1444289 RepID=A0A0A0HY22_CLONO|nr:ROK family protein [Clostridium novyi]KGM94119.1 glucokinase [Clostridium novyi A str. 4552]
MRIGIDLGGTNIAAGLVNNDGALIYKDSIKTNLECNGKFIIDDMVKLIENILGKNNFKINEITSIGIGVPGTVRYEEGVVVECVNLFWKEVTLAKDLNIKLREKFNIENDIKILIENDANAAALGEYLAGSMKDCNSAILITLGTGVGGGMVLNGKVHRGKDGAALEIGHMIVGENFYNCSCGNNGCLETFASATAIIKYAQELIKNGEKSIITDKVQGDLSKVDAKIVFDSAREGDKVGNLTLDRFIEYLGTGINNIINVLDLDVISIGGGVVAGSDLFMDRLIKYIKEHKLFKGLELCKIEKAKLGNDAGIIGAALLDRM